LSPDERRAFDQLDDFYKNGLGYAIEMNNRPQTLYGILRLRPFRDRFSQEVWEASQEFPLIFVESPQTAGSKTDFDTIAI
ncbi:hypothetical protein ACC771_01910, partial [Rhizobium ruizarguesonis]